VASFAWTRSGVGEAERRLAELAGRLRQMEEESAAAQQNLQATLQRQLALQQERIDAFIAAASTLLLDRLAGAPGREQDALRDLLDTGGAIRAGDPTLDLTARQLEVSPESSLFGTGWHREEIYPSGSFRWMGPNGLLLNPVPGRPVASVTLEICHLYRTSLPSLTAQLDDADAAVVVHAQSQGAFSVRLTHADGPHPLRVLRLSSLTGGSPAEDGASGDRRQLSFAVSRVIFAYAD
jgi:hypothetical protein